MVYMADSLALATLETLVHLEAQPSEAAFRGIEVSLPDEVVESLGPLPDRWQQDLERTRRLGSQWLQAGLALALKVPSTVVPDGSNLLVNPTHAAAARIEVLRTVRFHWDDRLF